MNSSQVVVSKTGEGFRTLQEAVLSIDDSHSETVTIIVKPGIYEEKVFIRKNNIRIVGENANTTIFRYGDGARKLREDGTEYGTFNTAVILFAGSDIEVENITIENTAGPGRIAGQALAVFVASDRTAFYNCSFHGYQDTIFTGDSNSLGIKNLILPDYFVNSEVKIDYSVNRNYFKDCYICGDVDFIFGPSAAFFDHCEIHNLRLQSEGQSYITAASTPAGQEYGYVFHQCDVTGESREGNIYLGRPWRDYAKTAFVECIMDSCIHPVGWHNWGRPKTEVTATYVELCNTGEGARTENRVSFSRQLTDPAILDYFKREVVLAGEDHWNPR